MTKHKVAPEAFPREEVMLIAPAALARAWSPFGDEPAVETAGGSAVVRIDGPLMQRGGWWWDGYDTVEARLRAALASESPSVVLRINSPGGVVAGCFESAARMRAAIEASGKPVVAYVDELAASAAYALAVVADRIVLPKSGSVGSVGVIASVSSYAKQLDREGIDVAVVASGSQKADLHPALRLEGDAVERLRARVMRLAGQFSEWVAARRPLTAEAVEALQAAVLDGTTAVSAGLADDVGSIDTALSVARELVGSRAPQPRIAGKATGATRMNLLLALTAVLGLPESATEQDATNVVASMKNAERSLLELTGTKTLAEALGAVHGFKAEAAKVSALRAEVEAIRAAETARARKELLDKAVIDKVMKPNERAEYDTSPVLLSAPIEFIEASLRTRTPEVKQEFTTRASAGHVSVAEDDERVARALGLDPKQVAAVPAVGA